MIALGITFVMIGLAITPICGYYQGGKKGQ